MYIPKDDPLGVYRPWFPAFIDFTAADYDPAMALDEVYGNYSLEDLRQYLWRMYKAALSVDDEYDTGLDRSNLTFFFECMNDLLNAGYLIARTALFEKKLREQSKQPQ